MKNASKLSVYLVQLKKGSEVLGSCNVLNSKHRSFHCTCIKYNTTDKGPNISSTYKNAHNDKNINKMNVAVADQSFIKDVVFDSPSEQPFYYRPAASTIDYNVVYTKNTFISASRALSDYLLTPEDLEGMRKTFVRTAYNDSNEPPDYCYLKLDVEKRALERWGSMEALRRECGRRREALEAGERYRKGLSSLIGHLKKTVKDQTKKEEENKLFGSRAQRELMVKGSAKVVLYAIASNLTVTFIKFGAYFYTGSASMLSEAIHSLADAANQMLLGVGIWQSIKKPSPDHPYGWSKSRYIYSLISGCGIFFLGCGFSVYHGISELFTPTNLESLYTAYGVLGISFAVESLTMGLALKQVIKSANESGVSLSEYVTRGRDPNAVAVLLEDSAALIGIIIAATSIGLTNYTGNAIFDAVGSISIGALLGIVAVFLIQRNADSLVGRSIHPDRLRQIINVLENDIMIRSLHDVKATDMGADTVRFKAEVNFDGRELTRVHLNRLDMDVVLQEMRKINTPEHVEQFMLEHGEQIIDVLGSQVDRIERNLKKHSPEVRHVDLEIL
ncbi:proton-coupled zinc antiporter SLC30A9, mitochondrial-like [Hydractinia symbiolongicarpus]|uniref:proton-coupled zinc antiporter SLC30A9, mitochondrial-like n=1 Tax=Hydractinia symbiolongicarpus TaxID=13093 RepID=UPI0025501D05|nr:proton-coupled zinc antiporter SLC30A9, mitochondrial-like [Hydractinia symbiolongicarpus]